MHSNAYSRVIRSSHEAETAQVNNTMAEQDRTVKGRGRGSGTRGEENRMQMRIEACLHMYCTREALKPTTRRRRVTPSRVAISNEQRAMGRADESWEREQDMRGAGREAQVERTLRYGYFSPLLMRARTHHVSPNAANLLLS